MVAEGFADKAAVACRTCRRRSPCGICQVGRKPIPGVKYVHCWHWRPVDEVREILDSLDPGMLTGWRRRAAMEAKDAENVEGVHAGDA